MKYLLIKELLQYINILLIIKMSLNKFKHEGQVVLKPQNVNQLIYSYYYFKNYVLYKLKFSASDA